MSGSTIAPNGWRTIDSAPKDGTKVLLRFAGPFPDIEEDGVVVGRLLSRGWWLSAIWAAGMAHQPPTRWQPLPPPPTEAQTPALNTPPRSLAEAERDILREALEEIVRSHADSLSGLAAQQTAEEALAKAVELRGSGR